MSSQADQAHKQIGATYATISDRAAEYCSAYWAGDSVRCSELLALAHKDIDDMYSNVRIVVDDTKINYGAKNKNVHEENNIY